jgi:Protein of unknown function (DUF1552)
MKNGTLISRRTVLRGVGAAVALPLLEAMAPLSLAAAAAKAQAPKRMAFLFIPIGAHMANWTPKAEGASFDLSPTLQPLAPFQKDLLVLSGLACDKARANGDGAGDHARSGGAWLTGCQPRKTAGANFQAGISVDQLAANRLGDQTRLPSLELGIDRYRGSGNCDSGYSCVYEHTVSWRSPTSPLPTETNPKLVFERLFSDKPNSPERLKRNELRGSVLDTVLDDAHSLEKALGGADKQKLDQYLSCVRELELRIARVDKLPPIQPPKGAAKPEQVPAVYQEHCRLMCDLLALSFQTDVTRIATFMLAREGSDFQYRNLGISEGHHESTHHRGDKRLIENVCKINKFHVEQLAYLLGKLKAIPEGDGTLLDNCMIAYGSGIEDGSMHTHTSVPTLLAGKGGGTLKTGRHLRFPTETPLNNLWLSMLDRMGVPTSKLGDSTGVLQGLS